MRITKLIGGASLWLLAYGCADRSEHAGVTEQSAVVVAGNAPRIGLNAPAIGLNAPRIGLNAPRIGLNAPGMGLNAPDAGLDGLHAFGERARALVQVHDIPYYLVTDELTTILQPRAIPGADVAGSGCAGKGFTRNDAWGAPIRAWRFARSHRDAFGNIISSDVEVQGATGVWTPLRGQASALILPARLTSLGATTAPLDALVKIKRKRASAYACTPWYRTVALEIEVAIVREGRCFDWIDLGRTTFVPAMKSLVPRYTGGSLSGLIPRGDGWAMPVSADESSALFKAVHYSRAILDFDDASDDDATAWHYRYPTTAATCAPASSGAASCISGASIVAAYGLALANLVPITIHDPDPALTVVAGHPGTVTGQPVYVSVMKEGRTVRWTRFETAQVGRVAAHLAPGELELAVSSPFPYDAAVGPKTTGRSCLGSTRVGIGTNQLRVSAMRADTSGQFAEPYRSAALSTYDETCTEAPPAYNIAQLSFAGDFVVSALPVAHGTVCPAALQRPVDNPNDVFLFFDENTDPET